VKLGFIEQAQIGRSINAYNLSDIKQMYDLKLYLQSIKKLFHKDSLNKAKVRNLKLANSRSTL
jgi:hypothetical protein